MLAKPQETLHTTGASLGQKMVSVYWLGDVWKKNHILFM